MKTRCFALLAAWLLTILSSPAETALTVSAAASLTDALMEIKALYSKEQPGVSVTFNFGGSGALQQQIENGAPADVFISAAPKQMDALEKKGLLLAGTRRDLLGNELVLIAPKNSKAPASFEELTKPEVQHIAVGDPRSVPAGTYAAEVFAKLKLTEALEPKLVRMLDVRQVLTSVETGNAEAGLVYRTDARLSEKVRLVASAPEASHAPIIYPLAVIGGSKQAEAAKGFVTYLGGAGARAVFTKFGFAPLP